MDGVQAEACSERRTTTLVAATPREIGSQSPVALDGDMKAWREAGYPIET